MVIANGNPMAGMALQVRLLLARSGIAVSALSNVRPHRQQRTEIQYSRNRRRDALALNEALNGAAVMVPILHPAAGSGLRLVLGKDAALALALRAGSGRTLAAN